jgi:hypothetical protein
LATFHRLIHPDVRAYRAFLPVSTLGGVIVVGVVFSVSNALLEEIVFRGIFYDAIESQWGASVAVVASALIFGYGHLHGYPPGPSGAMLAGRPYGFPDPFSTSPGWLARTPRERLQQLPRYLKAAGLRLDKLRADPQRDQRLAAELAALEQPYRRELAVRSRNGAVSPQLDQFGWLIEELRVSLFAQELRTPVPVSVKRLAKLWQSVRR